MSSVAAGADRERTVSVPGSRLREFEPSNLGAFHPRFRHFVARLEGQPQSVIRRLLIQEAMATDATKHGAELLGYRVVLLVLRDYVASGYYPISSSGRCYLAPIFESPGLTDEQRRTALGKLYRTARDRALVERESSGWLARASEALLASGYNAGGVLDLLVDRPPRLALEQTTEHSRMLDSRGLWRSVRATWSMGPEASAPGREVAFIAVDERAPGTPLGILQFRNVVPEIMPRDLWLGISVGDPGNPVSGYAGLIAGLSAIEARDRIAATGSVINALLSAVNRGSIDIEAASLEAIPRLMDLIGLRQEAYRNDRRAGRSDAHDHLTIIKRAETLIDLIRGSTAAAVLGQDERHPLEVLREDERLRRNFDAGLRKLWHYHMGFVALELSVCGAAPPFGALRAGKLLASLAGSADVVNAWGRERPLGQIASKVYQPEVREAVPNPGPLVIFTSGLFPGHSAQYNRVESGGRRWRKIGETTGFGSFHIAVDTLRAINEFNVAVDGYAHVSRTFGEGSGARFRAVGKALSRLGLPDLRKHETRRPLYALPLSPDVPGMLLGWEPPRPVSCPATQNIADDWWRRWVEPRRDELISAARTQDNLNTVLSGLVERVRGV